jgi:hypothetical protein
LNEEFNGEPSDLPGMYHESIEQFRDILLQIESGGRGLLAEYSRHARAVADILQAICDFFDDSRPAKPADIREHMTNEMDALWKIRNILMEDLNLYDGESFHMAVFDGTAEVKKAIYDDLGSIRGSVKKALPNSVRAAWDDLSDRNVSSKRRIRSRDTALQCLQDLTQSWLTFSEKLRSAGELWNQKGYA